MGRAGAPGLGRRSEMIRWHAKGWITLAGQHSPRLVGVEITPTAVKFTVRKGSGLQDFMVGKAFVDHGDDDWKWALADATEVPLVKLLSTRVFQKCNCLHDDD